jgi:type III secretion protein J
VTTMISGILERGLRARESAFSEARARDWKESWLRAATLMLVATMLCACSKVVTLQTNLKDADANEIVLVLNQNGIEVEKQREKEGVSLTVKEADLSRASAAMNAAGLPKRNPANLGEVFKKQGMISSPLEERVRYIYGLSEELGYTLQQFDHVISARVHVVLPERVAPGEPILPSSAAVFVKYRAPLDEDAVIPRIRNLVSSSIPGLSGEEGRAKVSVVMIPTDLPPPSIEWTKVGPFKVQAVSAGGLMFTLCVLVLLVLGAVGVALFEVAKRNPKVAAMLNKYTAPAASMVARARTRRTAAGNQ